MGGGQVDLVDNRDDLEVRLQGQVKVSQGLSLDALGGVDDQQGAFAGVQGAADLVAEVDVTGGVDQVQLVGASVLGGVVHAHGGGLDGDALLAFQVHAIEDLFGHVAIGNRAGKLQQAVGQGGFAVVDVGDDTEVADVIGGHMRGEVYLILGDSKVGW